VLRVIEGEHFGRPDPCPIEHLEGEALVHVHVLDAVDGAHHALAERLLDPVSVGHEIAGRQWA
jgi:hypothetical protein